MDKLDDIQAAIRQFRDERDWMQFHNPKNLASSIVIEAAELLEHFQWKTPQESEAVTREQKAAVAEEIADVAIYLIELADNLGIDLIKAANAKLKKNAEKYPAEQVRGSSRKYIEYSRKREKPG
jgi:NTP pyrophosphatase (non-canonical NTP hydrolase)